MGLAHAVRRVGARGPSSRPPGPAPATSAGFRVAVPARPDCCGLTWITTGQPTTAKRVLRRTVDVPRPHMEMTMTDTPVVERVDSAVFTVPTDAPEADGTLAWDSTTLVLATVRCGEIGRASCRERV